MMRPVIFIVLICAVNVATGDRRESTDSSVCKSPVDVSADAETTVCGDGEGRPKTTLGDSFNAVVTKKGPSVVVGVPQSVAHSTHVSVGDTGYDLLNFHFHLGKDSTQEGSHHTENGKHHGLEMHVSTDWKNGELGIALVFFVDERDGEDNPAFSSLTSNLKNLKNEGDTFNADVNLREIVASAIDGAFYQYRGSPIEQPCGETIIWIIYQKTLEISKAQMQAFRDVGIAVPFRPIQKPADHKLYNSAKPC